MRDYLESTGHVSQLRTWDVGFMDSKAWILDDIPSFFEGATQLKVSEKFTSKALTFNVNQKIALYAAVPESKSNPLPSDFEFTDNKLSLLRVNPNDSGDKPKALASIGYKIYMKNNIPPGAVSIDINQKEEVNVIFWV